MHLRPLNVLLHKGHVSFLIVGHLRVSEGEFSLSRVITCLVIIHSLDDDLLLIVTLLFMVFYINSVNQLALKVKLPAFFLH